MGKGIRRTPEQIIRKLRQAEVLSGQGKTVEQICRELGVSDATYYKWKSKFAGMEVSDARRLRDVEDENWRLKKLVPDLSLDKMHLEELLKKI